MRRLWAFLVRQEKVQDIFIRLVFGKKHVAHHSSGAANADSASVYSDAAGQGIVDVFKCFSRWRLRDLNFLQMNLVTL